VRAMGQAMHWINDPANEKAVTEIVAQRLKVDESTAARTYKFMVSENKAFRNEAAVDGPGLAEMIRLLASDNMIPERKPWETFVDPAFMPAAK
jgi:ABC-type nitrate/sulfonate/bicarbonate transport system substrate-binding protein